MPQAKSNILATYSEHTRSHAYTPQTSTTITYTATTTNSNNHPPTSWQVTKTRRRGGDILVGKLPRDEIQGGLVDLYANLST